MLVAYFVKCNWKKTSLTNNTFSNKAIFAIERYLDIWGYSHHETT